MSARNDSTNQRNLPVPYWRQRSSPRRLSKEEIETIQVLKRNYYSDRQIKKIVNRSLGAVARYTKGMRPLLGLAEQSIPLVKYVEDTIAPALPIIAVPPTPQVITVPPHDSAPQQNSSQSYVERVISARLNKIREINAKLDRSYKVLDMIENQSDWAWRREYQKHLERALQHYREKMHLPWYRVELCFTCNKVLRLLGFLD